MPIQITQISDHDIEGAITCIQRAFDTDPYNNWVFDRSAFSVRRNRISLGLRCAWGQKHALFHVAKDPTSANPDEVIGVACWMPPADSSTPQSWYDYLAEWELWFRQGVMNLVHGRGGLRTERYWIWKGAQAEAQRELWTDPKGYYFCNIVTVLPEAQGKGVGKALFRHVTDQANREGRRCYLESSWAEPNMAIYERMGFECRKEMVCDDRGEAITLYCMVREPEGKSKNDD